MKTFIKISIIFIFIFLVGSFALAEDCCIDKATDKVLAYPVETCAENGGKWICEKGSGSKKVEPLPNPLGDIKSPQQLIGQIINALLGLVGSLALLMFIYGGFVWMMAAGNQEKITKGKNVLVWAIIGMIIIFASYALVNFIIMQALGAK